jgi:hypothetical protein
VILNCVLEAAGSEAGYTAFGEESPANPTLCTAAPTHIHVQN